ncbi:hypothetical protein D3C81_1743140 [compost metagenome]
MAGEVATVTKPWRVHDRWIDVADMDLRVVVQFTAQRFAKAAQTVFAGGIGSGIGLCDPATQ